MEKKRIYADGMETVSLTEGMIRMEIYAVPAVNKTNNEPEHEVFAELIMPPQGFIRAYSTMENLVNQLTEAGIVKRKTEKDEPQSSAPAAPQQASPNFN